VGRRLTTLALAGALAVLVALPADALGAGLKRVSYRATDTDAPRTFFDNGGLRLRGSCEESQDLNVVARTNFDNALISYNAQSFDGDAYAEDTDLDTGQNEDLFDELGFSGDSTAGQIIYARPGGKVVTVDFSSEEGEINDGDRDCAFVGVARVLDSTSSNRINFRAQTGTGPTEILSKGGLTLTARCTAEEDGFSVLANTAVDDAMIHHNGQSDQPADNTDLANHLDDFDQDVTYSFDALRTGVGQVIYARPDGKVVTVDWAKHDQASMFGNDTDCAVVGAARVRSPGDPTLLDFAADSPTVGFPFFTLDGLQLKAACFDEDLITRVRSLSDNSMIHANMQTPFEDPDYGEDDEADNTQEEERPLFGFNDPYFEESSNEPDGSSGQLISATEGGTYVTVDWLQEESGEPFDGQDDCAFLGTAEISTPG
jgi:hypothetical protein